MDHGGAGRNKLKHYPQRPYNLRAIDQSDTQSINSHMSHNSISGRSIVMDNSMLRGGMDHHANEEQQIPSLKHVARNGYANMNLHGQQQQQQHHHHHHQQQQQQFHLNNNSALNVGQAQLSPRGRGNGRDAGEHHAHSLLNNESQSQLQQVNNSHHKELAPIMVPKRNGRAGNRAAYRRRNNYGSNSNNHDGHSYHGSAAGHGQSELPMLKGGVQSESNDHNSISLPSITSTNGHNIMANNSQAQMRRQQQQQQAAAQQHHLHMQQQQQQQFNGGMNIPNNYNVPREALPAYSDEQTNAAVTSMKGLKPNNPNWVNQDNNFIIERFDNKDLHFYCVLDGHGEHGHHISRKAAQNFPQHIRSSNFDMKKAFNIVQNDLNNCEYDARCSGATCVLAVLTAGRLSVSNCGDSRAVLGRRNLNGTISAHALTIDHKPDKPEERKRILSVGGHLGCRQVLVNQPGRGPVSMPVGPCRVWYQHRGETLGLAMSRSLGDSIAHKSGVSAEPEILDHAIDEYDEFMIIATDGVWDVVDNNQAVQMVNNFASKSSQWSAVEAATCVCKFARSRWEKLSPMIDDITCLVVKIRGRS